MEKLINKFDLFRKMEMEKTEKTEKTERKERKEKAIKLD